MTDVRDHYRNAPHYDYEYADLTADIGFNVRLAQEFASGGKVLEFCAGTGRITFPLVAAGIDGEYSVVGVDLTPGMLNIAKEKLLEKPPEVQEALVLIEGDMRNVDVGKGEFDLVLIPFNSCFYNIYQFKIIGIP